MKVSTTLFLFVIVCSFTMISSCASTELEKEQSYPIIPAVNAYSFSDLLTARDYRNKEFGSWQGL